MDTEVAVVTGGAGRIGRGVCRALTKAEVAVVGIDTLVNLAQRILVDIDIMKLTDEDMRVSFESGPMASLRMMQLCYPHIRARGGGAIVNFASEAGTAGIPGQAAYAAAKEAIRGITKVAALEWGRDNIRVNAVCPVAWPTPEPDHPLFREVIANSPMGRIGDPETDIGAVVVFLAGPGRYITGRTLHVDGGHGTFR